MRIVFIALSVLSLAACSVSPKASIDDFRKTASGAVQGVRETAKEIEERAQNAKRGIAEVASGAGLIKKSLMP